MPQPKSSRKPAARTSTAKPAARKSATPAKGAATRGAAAAKRTSGRSTAAKAAAAQRVAAQRRSSSAPRKPAARSGAAKAQAPKAAARKQPAPASGADDALRSALASVRDALRQGVVLTNDGVREAMDDAVKRGRMTRRDATELTTFLLDSGRRQADTLRADVEQLLGRGRRGAAQSGDAVLREVDRARRRVGVGPAFPISLYDDLTAAQVSKRLGDLTPPELRKVRDHERRNAKRASVLKAIERKLG